MRNDSFTGPTRHNEYYFEDGNVILLVESVLFSLHRGVLRRHSELFLTMLSLPQSPSSQEGLHDRTPILLPEVKSRDFERLLWILYPQ